MTMRVELGKGQKDRYAMLSPLMLERLRVWWRVARAQSVGTRRSFFGALVVRIARCQSGDGRVGGAACNASQSHEASECHRGTVLGALLGAALGPAAIPECWIRGLTARVALDEEIEDFIARFGR